MDASSQPTANAVLLALVMLTASSANAYKLETEITILAVKSALTIYNNIGVSPITVAVEECKDCDWTDVVEVGANVVLLTASHGHSSKGTLFTLDTEKLIVLSSTSTCIHPVRVWKPTVENVVLVHCKGYGIQRNASPRESELQLLRFGRGWKYEVVAGLPLQSGTSSSPLSHETSFCRVLHNGLLLYIDTDGRRLSLASVTQTRFKSVVSYSASSPTLDCQGKFTDAVQDGINHHIYISCTHTRMAKILQLAVSDSHVTVLTVYEVHGVPFMSPVLDGPKQFISAIDQTKREMAVIKVVPGESTKLKTVQADVELVKGQCVFVIVKTDAKQFCLPLKDKGLYFVYGRQLENGSSEFAASHVKLPHVVDSVDSISDSRLLIVQGGQGGSQVRVVDPNTDSVISKFTVLHGSKVLRQRANSIVAMPVTHRTSAAHVTSLSTSTKASATPRHESETIVLPTSRKLGSLHSTSAARRNATAAGGSKSVVFKTVRKIGKFIKKSRNESTICLMKVAKYFVSVLETILAKTEDTTSREVIIEQSGVKGKSSEAVNTSRIPTTSFFVNSNSILQVNKSINVNGTETTHEKRGEKTHGLLGLAAAAGRADGAFGCCCAFVFYVIKWWVWGD